MPAPVAAQSKALVLHRSNTGILKSNLVRGIEAMGLSPVQGASPKCPNKLFQKLIRNLIHKMNNQRCANSKIHGKDGRTVADPTALLMRYCQQINPEICFLLTTCSDFIPLFWN